MRVVFFGTPEPAAVALDGLLASRHDVAAAVTQPDRPKGRSGAPQAPPAKVRALEAGIAVLQPDSPRDPDFTGELASFAPDACAVVAYGHLLPPEVLSVPPRGFVNVHFSLLPRYRGAAPVQRAIMAGETETGVSTFLLEPTLDTGPVLVAVREPIAPEDTAGTLMQRLATIGARVLIETLDGLESGTLTPTVQDAALATPAPKIKPEEGEIDWTRPAPEIVNTVRGLDPVPGAFSTLGEKRLKIWRVRSLDETAAASGNAPPGSVVALDGGRIGVATGSGVVELLEVQLEGSKRLDAVDFTRGHALEHGQVLGRRA